MRHVQDLRLNTRNGQPVGQYIELCALLRPDRQRQKTMQLAGRAPVPRHIHMPNPHIQLWFWAVFPAILWQRRVPGDGTSIALMAETCMIPPQRQKGDCSQ
jgi:hypothetical protein